MNTRFLVYIFCLGIVGAEFCHASNPLIGKKCKFQIFSEFHMETEGRPMVSTFPYTKKDIQLMDKIIKQYCKVPLNKCHKEILIAKKKGRSKIVWTYDAKAGSKIKDLRCFREFQIYNMESSVSCAVQIQDTRSMQSFFFNYEIPELKGSDFEGCLKAKKACQKRLQLIKRNKPDGGHFCSKNTGHFTHIFK